MCRFGDKCRFYHDRGGGDVSQNTGFMAPSKFGGRLRCSCGVFLMDP